MKNKPIIIVAGEPKSVFFEILFKSLKSNPYKSPLILIASLKILKLQMKKFKFNKKIKIISLNNLNKLKLNNTTINLIDVKLEDKNSYIRDCFDISFKILNSQITNKLKLFICCSFHP